LNTQHIKGTRWTQERIASASGRLLHRDFRTDCEYLVLAPDENGFLKNHQWEVYARTTTQRSALTVLATFFMKPVKLSNP
jgi:hypothetical protein